MIGKEWQFLPKAKDFWVFLPEQMKTIVIGLSPYLLTSRSKVSSLIMRYLYIKSIPVHGVVWGHDATFFPPEENGSLYYEFPVKDNGTHKIPLRTFRRGEKEAIEVYEIVNSLEPELIVTVGDYADFLYMKAVKTFYRKPCKWLFVLLNYSAPIDPNNYELLNDVDGVLCTSDFARESIDFYKKEIISTKFLGSSYTYNPQEASDRFRIMVSGKSHQADNIPMVMECVASARKENPNIELYVHSTLYDKGDYDLEQLKHRFDPNDEFISFPDKYVSIYEGIPDVEFVNELSKADLFISVPLVSATSMTVFDAIACNCKFLVSDCGSNRDIVNLLAEKSPQSQFDECLILCVRMMSANGSYLNICDDRELTKKIITISKNWEKNRGKDTSLSELIKDCNREGFLNKLSEMIEQIGKYQQTICLES